jgi:outer membrane immunogenic protein
MRKFVFALLAVPALAGVAHAGDLPSQKTPVAPPPVVVAYDWTGFYGGLQGGGAFGQTNFALPASGYTKSIGNSGVFGGVHAGYNYQVQSLVLGAEAEFSALGDKGDFGDNTTFAAPYRVIAHHDWIGSVDGKLGVAYKNYLIYATGGYAFAQIGSTVLSGVTQVGSISTSLNGYDIGGGVEYAFTRNWSGNLEYRYYEFDKFQGKYTSAATLFTEKLNYSTIRVGVTYHWVKDEPPVVVAKY